ncbi:MAG: 5-(carboxyamino)imidazole ribonucleotide synthase [Luteolibacter sp.]|uniref:5-(carboxyamino)imidazole ribonucleotide synthase n=1 Tax=Luteolibacter sp. TaxID=1962973 RepID=UPI0032668E25
MSPQVPIHTPHCIVGVIGGGQLGRMIALAARRMGVRTVIWTGGLEAPAVECADEVIDKPFDDAEALADFCSRVTVATVEFENIPCETLEKVAKCIDLYPSPRAICITQNREREKNFLKENNIPHTWFAVIASATDLAAAMKELNGPGVLKTADFGYDGKGQVKLEGDEDPEKIWASFGAPRSVLEAWVPFEKELSVMAARGADGITVTYDPAENRHRHHILDVSIIPARVSPAVALEAAAIARRVAEALDYRGILGVEFFLKKDGSLLVNEIAPRPHNSGHHTLDACVTSQFTQQLRAVIGLPLGSTRLHSPVAMLNLLGDMWRDETTPPDWLPLFEDPETSLHLYGKRRAIGRRKMGHANFLGPTAEDALERAEAMKALWLI